MAQSSLRDKGSLLCLALLISFTGLWWTDLMPVLMPFLTLYVLWKWNGDRKIPLCFSPPALLMGLLLFWGGVSIAWGGQPLIGLKAIGLMSLTCGFAMVLTSAVLNSSSILEEKTFFLLKWSLVFLIIIIVFQYSHLVNFTNSPIKFKFAGSTVGLLIFVTCPFLWIKEQRFLSIFLVICGLAAIMLTQNQRGIYGLILGGGVFFVSYLIPMVTTWFLGVSSALFMLLTPLLYGHWVPVALARQADWVSPLGATFYHRVLIWEFMLEKIREAPLLGWGAGSSTYLATTPLASGYSGAYKPHNAALEAYVELGMPGGILYGLFFASFFWLVAKFVKEKLSVAVCNGAIFFVFVQRTLDNELWDNKRFAWFALLCAAALIFIQARAVQLPSEADHSKPSPIPGGG